MANIFPPSKPSTTITTNNKIDQMLMIEFDSSMKGRFGMAQSSTQQQSQNQASTPLGHQSGGNRMIKRPRYYQLGRNAFKRLPDMPWLLLWKKMAYLMTSSSIPILLLTTMCREKWGWGRTRNGTLCRGRAKRLRGERGGGGGGHSRWSRDLKLKTHRFLPHQKSPPCFASDWQTGWHSFTVYIPSFCLESSLIHEHKQLMHSL